MVSLLYMAILGRSALINQAIKGPHEAGDKYRPTEYFKDFNHTLRETAQRDLRTDPAHGLNQALEAVRRLTEKYGSDNTDKTENGILSH